MWWIIIFIVFILMLLVWLGVIFYQRRISLKIDTLDQEKGKLLDPNIEEKFAKLNQTNPTGESLATLNQLQQSYERLKNRQFVDLETFFFEAEDTNNKFQFIQGNRKISELENKLTELRRESTEIQQALSKFQDVQIIGKDLIEGINSEITDVKRSILSKGYAYGPAHDNLERRLAKIDEGFDNAQQVYLGGDYAKAKPLLETISHELADLKNDLKEIEFLYGKLNKTFPDQIQEIKDTYEKMKKTGYQFIDDDFENQVLLLENLVEETVDLLTQAAISDVQINCEQLNEQIDQLYTILEREYKSRHVVQKNKDDVYQFIIHADRQNRALNETIYQASNHFVLHDNEAKKITDLSSQIEDIRLNYNRNLQKVIDKEAVYSVINRDLELWRKQLTKIEEDQVQIGTEIEKKYDKVEQLAKNLLEDDSALKVIARYVEKENLSGVPQDYQEFYLVVSHELKKARKLLNETRVDVEQAEKVLNLLQEDLETLARKTNEMIKSSRLTEILIQNAIQYQENNPSVTDAIERAKEVYQQDCDYEQAVEIIAKELEMIKPGTFQEIANNYNDQDQLKIQLNK